MRINEHWYCFRPWKLKMTSRRKENKWPNVQQGLQNFHKMGQCINFCTETSHILKQSSNVKEEAKKANFSFPDMKHFPCPHNDFPFHRSLTIQLASEGQSSLVVEEGALGWNYIFFEPCLLVLPLIDNYFFCFCRLKLIITESVTAMLQSRFPYYVGK